MAQDVFAAFPALAGLEAEARALLAAQARPMRLPAGALLFRPGELCAGYPFLMAGRVVVRRIARSGRQIVLYRVGPGQTCIMSTTCLMTGAQASAEAVVEQPAAALVLAPAGFARLLERSAGFRSFAFGACARRIGDLMARIEEMADIPIDRRLAARLLAVAGPDGTVRATHAALAGDIGTAREVVTRAMGHFAAAGWVRPGRGAAALLDPGALRALADGDDVTDSAAATG
jgi:CRP/FNR family transcriptional regulator